MAADNPKILIAFIAWSDVKGVTSQDMMRLCGGPYTRKTVYFHDGIEVVHQPDKSPMGMVVGQVMILSTLLPHGRNVAIGQGLKHFPGFTHILFVDHDMSNYTQEMIVRMVSHDVDVVAPLMTRRVPPFSPCCCPVEKNMADPYERGLSDVSAQSLLDKMNDIGANGLLECYHVGTAFTLIKREALDAVMDQTPEGPLWFEMDRLPRPGIKGEFQKLVDEMIGKDWADDYTPEKVVGDAMVRAFELGLDSRRGSILMGEDVTFCRKVRAAGLKIYVDTTIEVLHIGDRPYGVKDSLAVMKAEQERMNALGPFVGQVKANPDLPPLAA